MSSLLVWYRTDEGGRTALLVKTGRKYAHILTMDTYPLRVRRVKVAELKYMRVMDYPISKALKVYRRLARRDYGLASEWPSRLREALTL